MKPVAGAFALLVLGALAGPALAAAAPAAGVTLALRRVEFPTTSPGADPSGKAVLVYPEVTSIADRALRASINALIGPKAALGSDLDELRDAFASGEYPFDEASAQAAFNRAGILQVAWTVTATGAYTSVSRSMLTVDTAAGTVLGPRQMFADPDKLAAFLDSKMHPTAEARMKAVMDANPDAADMLQDQADNLSYTADMLGSVELGDHGATFRLEFDFPHAIAALEPDPVTLRLTWNELRPFLVKGGALLRLAGGG